MDRWEQELREALQRHDAPAGFNLRLQQRIAREYRVQPRWRRWIWSWRWAEAVVLCLLVLAGSGLYRQRQEREQRAGEKAKQDVLLALRITHVKMQLAAEKVQKVVEQ